MYESAYEQGREEGAASFEYAAADDGPGYDNQDEYLRGVTDEQISQVYGDDVVEVLNLIRNGDTSTLQGVAAIIDSNAYTGGLTDSLDEEDDHELGSYLDGAMATLINVELRRRGEQEGTH